MERITVTVRIDFDGPLTPEDIDGIVENLQETIERKIESGDLKTRNAEPSDYEFEHEAS